MRSGTKFIKCCSAEINGTGGRLVCRPMNGESALVRYSDNIRNHRCTGIGRHSAIFQYDRRVSVKKVINLAVEEWRRGSCISNKRTNGSYSQRMTEVCANVPCRLVVRMAE